MVAVHERKLYEVAWILLSQFGAAGGMGLLHAIPDSAVVDHPGPSEFLRMQIA